MIRHSFRKIALGGSAAIALLVTPGAVLADTQAAPPPAGASQTAAPAVGAPALWRVADDDTTIYLFGTVHLLPEGLNWYGPEIARALTSSSELVTEIADDAAMAAEMQQLIATRAMLPEGENVRSLMSAENKAKYEAALAAMGVPAEAFDRFKPWMAAMTLSMLPLIQQGYNPEQGVEKTLMRQAGAPAARGALETAAQQIDIFDNLPQETQLRYLAEVVEQAPQMKAMIDAMVAEWAKGDADALARIMNQNLTDPMLADRLLYDRNRNWAAWIDDRLDRPGTVFVAVGAGHLAGANSVQEALAARGITVSRVQ